jgi:ribulose 1,5-bisphosphate carboxylase large subunit-like protein
MTRRAFGSFYPAAFAILFLIACGGGAEEQVAQPAGTTAGAEAVQAIETQEVLNASPEPAAPIGAIGAARDAADAANAHVQAIDSIASGQ